MNPSDQAQHNPPTHIVGIGASAGGLNALEAFFLRLPPDTNMAFVVIQHLSPHFKSLMDDLLARYTPMPIHMATHGLEVRANTVYLIPSNTQMAIEKNCLLLSERSQGPVANLPIDLFLTSLAHSAKSSAIGVILSGTGTDGSRGIRSIRAEGGLVAIQSPETAQFDGMPRSSLATGVCDYASGPGEIAQLLVEYAIDPAGVRKRLSSSPAADSSTLEYAKIFTQLQKSFEIDFSRYKMPTVSRRIRRRMDSLQIEETADYIALLADNADELHSLYRDLLIGVTAFFRDPQSFDHLARDVMPTLLRQVPPGEDLRIWSAGCATGEEAYSLAILASEAAEDIGFKGRISVFATDVHRASLEIAAVGSYDAQGLANVSAERLARYFKPVNGDQYRVNAEIRRLVVFAPHNLAKDPPFTKLDLVSCRNLLIYLQPDLQERVISLFHFALRPRGFLFLGSSEAIGAHSHDFEVVDAASKLFRKSRTGQMPGGLPVAAARPMPLAIIPSAPPNTKNVSIDRQLLHDYDAILARQVPGVIIDENRHVLHYCGDIARFLTPPKGRPGRELFDMLEGDLQLAIYTALPRAEKSGESVEIRNVRIKSEREEVFANIVVDPIYDLKSRTTHYHIHFTETRPAVSVLVAPESSVEFESAPHHQGIIADLKSELQSTKQNLQTAIEELQTSNEQLQATNEELLAANEELQSTNEELHSVNEELYTVNTEFERKNGELMQLNLDHDHLLASIEVGIIFLDANLRIRKFNQFVSSFFKLLPQDVGRPIDHIAYHLENGRSILSDAQRVLNTGQVLENEVITPNGSVLLRRVLPHRNEQRDIEGVVLTFTDVATLKEAERAANRANVELERLVDARTQELRASERLYRTLFESMQEGFALQGLVRDLEGRAVDYRFLEVNDAFCRLLGKTRENIVGHTAGELLSGHTPLWLEQVSRVAETGESCQFEERVDQFGRLLDVTIFSPGKGQSATVAQDITVRRQLQEEEARRQKLESLGVLAGGIAHDFNNIFTVVIGNLSMAAESDGLADDTRGLLSSTLQGCERACALSRQLLIFARGGDPVRSVLSPRKLLEESARMIAAGADVKWEWNVAEEPASIEADPGQVTQVFNNILWNAVQAMPGGGTIRIGVENAMLPPINDLGLPQGRYVRITLADEGCGIPPESLEKIFDPFYTTKGTGNGLGLASVHSIVKHHSGHIGVVSKVGQGTTFTLHFPETHKTPGRVDGVWVAPANGTRRVKVLVMDDEEPIRTLLANMLGRLGHEFEAVSEGEAAIERFRLAHEQGAPFDAVILDLTIPGGMNGRTVAEEILKLDPHARLVVSSGYSTDPVVAQYEQHGFCAAIVKPYKFESVSRTLATVIPAHNGNSVH